MGDGGEKALFTPSLNPSHQGREDMSKGNPLASYRE